VTITLVLYSLTLLNTVSVAEVATETGDLRGEPATSNLKILSLKETAQQADGLSRRF